jgi:hypothetical protein
MASKRKEWERCFEKRAISLAKADGSPLATYAILLLNLLQQNVYK